MDMTQNDLESLIKRNRMQHFKCFTISSFVIKVWGTHKIKLFALLVAHRLWSHKEVSIITLFDFASQVCGMLLDCTQEWGPETLSLCKLQAFLNNPEILISKSYRATSCCVGQQTDKGCLPLQAHSQRNSSKSKTIMASRISNSLKGVVSKREISQ